MCTLTALSFSPAGRPSVPLLWQAGGLLRTGAALGVGDPGGGVYGPAWVCPGPSPLFVSSPRDTGSLVMWGESCPLVCRNSRALSSQLRSTPAAGWTILAVSRGPAARGSALAPAQALRGASGWELGGGAHGALFSRASAFPEPCPWEPTLAKEEGLSFLKGVLTLGLAPSSPATAQPGAVSRDVTAGDWPL